MHPSTEPSPDEPSTEVDRGFAAKILHELLHRIEVRNANAAAYPGPGRCTFFVSHAWTDGAVIHLVYAAPPSDRTWGLARDTRRSLIDPGPWNEADNPALYYHLLDLEENWPGAEFREPGESDDLIWWHGDPRRDLPGRLSGLPEDSRSPRHHLTRRGSTTRPHQSTSRAATQTRMGHFRQECGHRPRDDVQGGQSGSGERIAAVRSTA
ncbi:MAG: hypothetical protein JWM76_4320 [Pseudonocardiales bacterium]|jgi:hypothetical protein|nr:hypothetical protein [Pseudonocardiales bacterium]